jgi:Protein of unknown function (DUF3987)
MQPSAFTPLAMTNITGDLDALANNARRDHTRKQETNGQMTDWPTPTSLPDALPPVAKFNPKLLPAALCDSVVDICDRMQCPPDFPAAATIVALSSTIGRQLGIRPKRMDDWLVVPNLWGALVGRPGVMKTPSAEEPMRPLRGLEAAAAEKHEIDVQDWQAGEMVAKEAAKVTADRIREAMKKGKAEDARAIATQHVRDEAEEPARKRYIINDTTVEKLGEILAGNPNGILLFRDELTGFLRTLEREGHEGSRSFYLEAWNGDGRFTYDRIGRGTIDIEAACVSILGGIQPGPLTAYISSMSHGGAGDDGLLQRFQVTVWPDIHGEWTNVDRPPNAHARRAASDVFNRMANLDVQALGATWDEDAKIPHLRFDPDAQSMFDEWRAELELKVRSGREHPAIEAHLSKYRSLVPSLALILHLAEGTTGSVGADSMMRAAGWAEYLETHARRLYSTAISPAISAARALAAKVLAGEIASPFTVRDIYRPQWTGLPGPDEANAAAEVLCDLDWLRSEKIASAGRPKTLFHANPKLRLVKS